MLSIKEHIELKPYTTLNLGGPADFFCECASVYELQDALRFAAGREVRAHILGGGSNTIFSDSGYRGCVIRNGIKGISIVEDSSDVLVTAHAGEDWESFVRTTVEKGFAGLECLSGIPGSVGAVPIQNVGAYGQEVKDTIETVTVLERSTLNEIIFRNEECAFSYRTSRFKTVDAGRYVVTSVTFRLKKNGRPSIHYPEVQKIIDASVDLSALADGRESLSAVRTIVIGLRKKKSMVIDPNDPNSRSVGSFFLNPIVEEDVLARVRDVWSRQGDGTPVPTFPFETRMKIPAAWLIEKTGFKKGTKKNGVGISENHTLALVNYNGTVEALLQLAREIQSGVESVFGIHLEFEANVIS